MSDPSSVFRTGDVLLCRAKGRLGRWIARIEGNGVYAHATVFDSPGSVVHIDECGARRSDPWQAGMTGLVLRPRPQLSPTEAARGHEWADGEIGKPYPYFSLFLLALLYGLNRVIPGLRRAARLFSRSSVCTAFVSRFLLACGRDVVPGVNESVEAFRDFLDSPSLVKLSIFPPPGGVPYPPFHYLVNEKSVTRRSQ